MFCGYKLQAIKVNYMCFWSYILASLLINTYYIFVTLNNESIELSKGYINMVDYNQSVTLTLHCEFNMRKYLAVTEQHIDKRDHNSS